MDPSSDAAYDVLWRALRGAAELFPDAKLHVGGDEVNLGCWRGSARVREWAERQQQMQMQQQTQERAQQTQRMQKRAEAAADADGADGGSLPVENRDPIEQAFAAFVSRAVGMAAAAGRAAVVWQEAFEAGADLPPTAEVEVWKVRGEPFFSFFSSSSFSFCFGSASLPLPRSVLLLTLLTHEREGKK